MKDLKILSVHGIQIRLICCLYKNQNQNEYQHALTLHLIPPKDTKFVFFKSSQIKKRGLKNEIGRSQMGCTGPALLVW